MSLRLDVAPPNKLESLRLEPASLNEILLGTQPLGHVGLCHREFYLACMFHGIYYTAIQTVFLILHCPSCIKYVCLGMELFSK